MQRPPTLDTHCYRDTRSPVRRQQHTDLALASSYSIEICNPHVSARRKQDEQSFLEADNFK